MTGGWVLALFAPFATCVALIVWLRRSAWAARLSDRPNERSLHTQPTPRIGGIAIVLSSMPFAMALAAPGLEVIWVLALALALVSLADDLRSLPIALRLAAHFAAAAIAVASMTGAMVESSLLAALAAMVGLAWMTNLYNFMDGADGLAGGMTVVGFAACALAAAQSGDTPLALGCAVLASSALGFLLFNFPPARLFMGDAGSIPLGFLAGALGLAGAIRGTWPPWFPLLVFSPFWVDASATIARRLLHRERIWIAHRSHYYQRLVLMGWSRRRLAVCAYALMSAAATSALAGRTQVGAIQCAILIVWAVLYVAAIAAIERWSALKSASP